MSNIISSDFFRVRRGAALRNTCIGVLAVIALVLVLTVFTSNMENSMVAVVQNDSMTQAELTELQQDLAEAESQAPDLLNGADFGFEMLRQFFIPLFFLPIAIAVFCADFSAGTYRNTLSYESSRTRVYLAKMALSVGICLAMVVGMVVVGWILGGVGLGFSGFTAAYFGQLLITLLLQLPIYLAFVAVCHCLIAITKKSSSTIAIFLVGYIVLVMAFQLLASSFPSLEWMMLLDPQMSGRLMAEYATAPIGSILFVLVYHVGITAAATALGLTVYKKTDMP